MMIVTESPRQEALAFGSLLVVCALLALLAMCWPAEARTRWPSREVQRRCFVDLTAVQDPVLRGRCLRLSRRLP